LINHLESAVAFAPSHHLYYPIGFDFDLLNYKLLYHDRSLLSREGYWGLKI
jgi:hypothetical protein